MADSYPITGPVFVMDSEGRFVAVTRGAPGTVTELAFVVDHNLEQVFVGEGEPVVSVIQGKV